MDAKMKIKSGENTLDNGGIYQEVGPKGGLKKNYCTVRDNQILPPVTTKGHSWVLSQKTPDSSR